MVIKPKKKLRIKKRSNEYVALTPWKRFGQFIQIVESADYLLANTEVEYQLNDSS